MASVAEGTQSKPTRQQLRKGFRVQKKLGGGVLVEPNVLALLKAQPEEGNELLLKVVKVAFFFYDREGRPPLPWNMHNSFPQDDGSVVRIAVRLEKNDEGKIDACVGAAVVRD